MDDLEYIDPIECSNISETSALSIEQIFKQNWEDFIS